MKKFGRGYVLDFNALMDEVRSPAPNNITATGSAHVTSGSTGESSPTGTPQSPAVDGVLSGSSSTANTPEEERPAEMKRMPVRMSVSRTGRCKNKDRQRISVFTSDDFYRASAPSTAASAKSTSATSSGGGGGGKAGVGGQERAGDRDSNASQIDRAVVDLDNALSAIDGNVQGPPITNCYSF